MAKKGTSALKIVEPSPEAEEDAIENIEISEEEPEQIQHPQPVLTNEVNVSVAHADVRLLPIMVKGFEGVVNVGLDQFTRMEIIVTLELVRDGFVISHETLPPWVGPIANYRNEYFGILPGLIEEVKSRVESEQDTDIEESEQEPEGESD